jgi:hypothetical protein
MCVGIGIGKRGGTRRDCSRGRGETTMTDETNGNGDKTGNDKRQSREMRNARSQTVLHTGNEVSGAPTKTRAHGNGNGHEIMRRAGGVRYQKREGSEM